MGNHVYYGRYLAMLEAARGEFLRHLGEPFLKLQELGVIFPVMACSFRFLHPARYDDLLTIRLWLRELRGARVTFVYRLEKEGGTLVLEGETQHVCTSLEEKPRRLPADLVNRLAPYLHLPEGESEAAGRSLAGRR